MAALQPAMKKRQVIANSNKTMFLWVAVMSAVLGISAVVAYFLFQQIVYKTKVTNELDATSSLLRQSNDNAQTLIQNIQVLETNAGLNSAKAQPDEKALQVILDALPADPNSLALGSSLQEKLLTGVAGVTIENLTVLPVGGDNTVESQLPFTFVVRAKDANALKDLLHRLERSIRIIDIDSVALEKNDNDYTMSVEAHAYYQSAKTVILKDKVVPVE
ncbi:MAG: hypothetical protein ABIP74_02915 [Candidatus Saccharimonas sp.]